MNQIHHRDDDYLPCSFYQSYTPNDKGFAYFMEDGKFYFAYFEDGEVVLRSEGYSSELARENGIVSVLKYKDEDAHYSTKKLDDERWVLCLKAANHQEIARSCPAGSENDAKLLLPSERTKLSARVKSDRMEDDYLICREYHENLDKVSELYPEFIAFQHENGKYYFAWISGKDILMRSEGYKSVSARDNGIESVIRNWDIEDRFLIEERHGAYFGVLKAGNRQEIGRTCPVNSEEEARKPFPSSRAKAALSASKADRKDDYLGCNEYRKYSESRSTLYPSFIQFKHEDGQFYFAWMHDDFVFMRSEGYSTAKARDNGIESVMRNWEDDEKYSVDEAGGLYYTVLKAGNRQEIARSCPFADEAEALASFPSNRAKLLSAHSALADTDHLVDDYLPCRDYENNIQNKSEKYPEFISFQHSDGKYYFAWINDKDEIIMRSEGYPDGSVRDNGIESVIKNREIESRYHQEEKLGWWYLILKAGNHQEIARSCPKESAEALGGLKWTPAVVAISAIPIASQKAAESDSEKIVKVSVEEKENDYLNCSEYLNHHVTDLKKNYAYFKHANGLYYFVIYNDDKTVRLRSEGFNHTDARDNELSAALRNLDIKERYVVLERGGYRLKILKDENGREVGRSCPEKIITPVPIAPIAAAATAAGAINSGIKSKDKDDDYLTCEAYKGHKLNDKVNRIAFFKHSNGQYYFAVYNADGSVKLRSEGFKTSQERDVEVSGVIKNINKPEMYSVIEKAGYELKILKDHTGREVGRSCPAKPGAAIIPPVIIPPVSVAAEESYKAPAVVPPITLSTDPIKPIVESERRGISPWWLLLLLLPLLWLLLRGCDGCNKTDVSVPSAPTPPVVVDTTPTPPPPPALTVCNCSEQTDVVFAMSSGASPKPLHRLGTNPEFGNSHGLTEKAFYEKLNNSYSSDKLHSAFLDRVIKAMGYVAWSEINPELFTSVEIPFGTSGNMGFSKAHKTVYAQLNTSGQDLLAFRLKAKNGCDLHFMKTCGNHFFFCPQ